MIEELLDELDKAWNSTEDPLWRGENPRCSEIHDILIPLFKKLKLREVFCFRGVSGTLSNKNNPLYSNNLYIFPSAQQPVEMNWKPYMEISAGIENIFKCLRLDYVWRLSYKNLPGIDKSGLRLAVHVTF